MERGTSSSQKVTFGKKGSRIDEMVHDNHVLFWPVLEWMAENRIEKHEMARKVHLPVASMRNWISRGFTPLRVYKALVAAYGLPVGEKYDERSYVIERVKTPFRLRNNGVREMGHLYDQQFPDSRFQPLRLGKVPKRSSPTTYIPQIDPVTGKVGAVDWRSASFTGPETAPRVPKGPITPSKKRGPYRKHGQAPLTNGKSVEMAPYEVNFEKVSEVTNAETHAGIVALARLSATLRMERDGLLIQVADRDNVIADLRQQLITAEEMLNEAMKPPAPPVMSAEEITSNQIADMHAVIRSIDPSLEEELSKINPK